MLLLFLLVPEVNALTYSDYTPFSEFSENIIYKSDTVDVITEKRYKYYKTNKEMGPYLLESANSDYEYIDYDDYILSAPSQILYEKPDDTNRVVKIKKEYEYKRVKPINYFKISVPKTAFSMQISNFRIYDGDKEITNYETVGYFTNFSQNPAPSYINPNGWLHFRLKEDVYLDELKISFDIVSDNVLEYTLIAGHNDKPYENTNVYINDSFKYQNINKYTFNFKDGSLNEPEFEYFYSFLEEESNVLIKTGQEREIYQYQDKLYRHYNLEKIYNDEYTKDAVGDYIYKDENDYKLYYAYRTRSILEDNLLSTANNLIPANNILPLNKQNTEKTNIDNSLEKELVEGKTIDDYSRPLEKINYTKANPIKQKTVMNENLLYLLYFFIFLILSIILLLLSKHYKNKINYGKV